MNNTMINSRVRDRIDARLPKERDPSLCWLWMGGTDRWGYGLIKIDGSNKLVHRVTWEFANGPIPEGLFVCHRCDVPACVNPAHLFLGTAKDNMIDMVRKGRNKPGIARGEKNGLAKLDWNSVRQIRASQGRSQRSLATEFGVHRDTIGAILRNKAWIDMSDDRPPQEAA